jgi:hypothetical protein
LFDRENGSLSEEEEKDNSQINIGQQTNSNPHPILRSSLTSHESLLSIAVGSTDIFPAFGGEDGGCCGPFAITSRGFSGDN